MQMYHNPSRFLDRDGGERVLLPMQARISPKVFSVDSRKRDVNAYPNPYDFRYALQPVGMNGIFSIDLVDVLWAVPGNYADAYVNVCIEEMPLMTEGASTNATAYVAYDYEASGPSNIKPGVVLPLLTDITLQPRALPASDGFAWWRSDMAGQRAIHFGPFKDKFNSITVKFKDAAGNVLVPTDPGAYVKLVLEVTGK